MALFFYWFVHYRINFCSNKYTERTDFERIIRRYGPRSDTTNPNKIVYNIVFTINLIEMKSHFTSPISFLLLMISIIILPEGCIRHETETVLSNGNMEITLAVNARGVPYINKVVIPGSDSTFFMDQSGGSVLEKRLRTRFAGKSVSISSITGWETSEDTLFINAESTVGVGKTRFTMHVELMKGQNIVRIFNSVHAGEAVIISEFPVFCSRLDYPDSIISLRWWKSLDFTAQQERITSDTHVSLFSRIHSSENPGNVSGNVPYWTISSPVSFTAFGLSWCGGWRADLNHVDGQLEADVYLPSEETQLKLDAGEKISGPELTLYFSGSQSLMEDRKSWMLARKSLAATKYPSPEMGIPLIYNHWYAVEFDLSEQYVKNQVENFGDYGFNVFMVDAGWYKDEGSWTPDQKKFPGKSFENALKVIQDGGAIAGLWSCPQYIAVQKPLPDYIDQPGLYNSFIKSWLIDYNAMDFAKFLVLHLDTLNNQLGADWWKFDQEFFSEKPRSGKMKSVIALQNGFAAARKAYPDMIFEACMGGGKMINEFTDAISQIHWIRDGSRTGYFHAVSNIFEALGAIDFLEPQKVQRWNNRINETEMKSPELLKFYCRSCILGSWGISADLERITPAQKAVILGEIKNYRRLNEIKKYNLYDYTYPGEYTNLVPVVFYDESIKKAGILFYRLFPNDKEVTMKLKTNLDPRLSYTFEDMDGNSKQVVKGNVFELRLKPGQLSGVFFISELIGK
jgi:hypothetical protein